MRPLWRRGCRVLLHRQAGVVAFGCGGLFGFPLDTRRPSLRLLDDGGRVTPWAPWRVLRGRWLMPFDYAGLSASMRRLTRISDAQ